LGVTAITWQTQSVIGDEPIDPTHASVHGLLGSLAKEYVEWQIRVIDAALEAEQGELPLAELLRVPADPQGNAWAYRSGEWYRQELLRCELKDELSATRFRQGGVYVVIGGAGGIGTALSEYLIRRYQAQLVWLGRRELDAELGARLQRLSQEGPRPTYICVDAQDRAALHGAYRQIKAQFGQIHGVVHAAMVLQDRSLALMDEERFRAGLAPKVEVSVRLAQVFATEPLDFVLFFSSTQSLSKAAGQSNYAAGCTFKDAFAGALAQHWSCAVKVMNWGYWGSVGVVASATYRARMAQQGFGSIEPAEGMRALEMLLGVPLRQLAMIKTIGPQVLAALADPDERLLLAQQSIAELDI
jgi:NAD(P)-dependent dehydrogenase (short-subunit alcohol dehydrogenase family)